MYTNLVPYAPPTSPVSSIGEQVVPAFWDDEMTELDAIIGADISNNTANLGGSLLPNLGPDVFHHAAISDGPPLLNLGPDDFLHAAISDGSPLLDLGPDVFHQAAISDGSPLLDLGPDVFHHVAISDGSPLLDLGPDVFDHVANLVGLPLTDSDAAANRVADISDHAANQVGATFPDIGAAANQVADILDHTVRSTLPEIHNIADNGDVVIANMWSDITYLTANTTTGRCIFNNAANFATTTNLVESIRPVVVYNVLRRGITTRTVRSYGNTSTTNC